MQQQLPWGKRQRWLSVPHQHPVSWHRLGTLQPKPTSTPNLPEQGHTPVPLCPPQSETIKPTLQMALLDRSLRRSTRLCQPWCRAPPPPGLSLLNGAAAVHRLLGKENVRYAQFMALLAPLPALLRTPRN